MREHQVNLASTREVNRVKIITLKDGVKVKQPGIYRMSNAWYHDNCCVGPSLSSTMAWALDQDCPRSVWFNSYLNKKREKKDVQRFDIGTAVHSAILEKDWMKHVTVVNAGNWSGSRAKFLKKQAKVTGGVALLKDQAKKIFAMREALFSDKECADIATCGQNELSYFWLDEETGVWLKVRPDIRLRRNFGIRVYDLKSSQGSSHVRAVQNRMIDMGYFLSAAMYLHVMEKVEGSRPYDFSLLCIEQAEPHLLNIVTIDELAIEWGKIIMRKSIDLFAECLKNDEWPSYERGLTAELPRGYEMQLEDRKDKGEFGGPRRASDGETRKVFGWGNDPKTLEAY